MREEFESGNRGIFSSALVQALGERLERGEKSVLFVNRRGSASVAALPQLRIRRRSARAAASRWPFTAARGCCAATTATIKSPIPQRCPACGIGSDSRVRRRNRARRRRGRVGSFPEARVLRMDSDTTTRDRRSRANSRRVSRRTATFWSERRWSPRVSTIRPSRSSASSPPTSVCTLPDFRAAERSFALIAQVCGRSGRARRGEAIVQTYAPDHPAIRFAAHHDYDGFAAAELRERAAVGFPPAQRLDLSRNHRARPEARSARPRGAMPDTCAMRRSPRCWVPRRIRSRA